MLYVRVQGTNELTQLTMADVVALEGTENSSSTKDKLFDPSVDMLINDFDDERTLEEEEALAAVDEGEDAISELSHLQKVVENSGVVNMFVFTRNFEGEQHAFTRIIGIVWV